MSSNWKKAQALCALLDLGCLAVLCRKKWKPAAALFGLHGLEWLLFGHRVGRLSGVSGRESFLRTLALGCTWWLPQNERAHEEMEAQVDQKRFQTKASGVKLAKGE